MQLLDVFSLMLIAKLQVIHVTLSSEIVPSLDAAELFLSLVLKILPVPVMIASPLLVFHHALQPNYVSVIQTTSVPQPFVVELAA